MPTKLIFLQEKGPYELRHDEIKRIIVDSLLASIIGGSSPVSSGIVIPEGVQNFGRYSLQMCLNQGETG